MDSFIGLDEYESFCGEEGSKGQQQTPQQGNTTKKIRPVKHPGLKLKTPIAFESNTDPNVIPIQKDGMGMFCLYVKFFNTSLCFVWIAFFKLIVGLCTAVCKNCGAMGVKHAFYTKERQFCSLACSRGEQPTPMKTHNGVKQDQTSHVQMPIQQVPQPVPMQQMQMPPQIQMQPQMQVLMAPQMQAPMPSQIQPQLQQSMQPIPSQMIGNGLQPQVPMQMQPMQAQMPQMPMGIPQMDQQMSLPVQPMQLQPQMEMPHMQMMQVMQTPMEVVPQVPMQCEALLQEEDSHTDQKPWNSSVSSFALLKVVLRY